MRLDGGDYMYGSVMSMDSRDRETHEDAVVCVRKLFCSSFEKWTKLYKNNIGVAIG